MELEMNELYLMELVLIAPACLCLPRPGHPSSHSHMLKSIAERHGLLSLLTRQGHLHSSAPSCDLKA